MSRADWRNNIEYLLVCDGDDPDLFQYTYKLGPVLQCVNLNHSCITAINYGALHSNGDLLIVVSDDMDCPEHWDTLLLTALQGKSDYCVKVNDGSQKWIITLPILDRKYYDRFGYIYKPTFRHLFADTHMTAVAWMLDRYLPVDLLFEHRHYTTGKSVKDRINVKNDLTWSQGEREFKRLRRINFEIPLNEIVNKSLPDISGLNVPRYQ